MIEWTSLGQYVDRPVLGAIIDHVEKGVGSYDLKGSLLFVRLTDTLEKGPNVDDLISSLIGGHPLALVFSGPGASSWFDLCIEQLSDGRPRPHIMTKLSAEEDLAEAIADFLSATWPSEDRFDDWQDYRIVFVGPSGSAGIAKASESISLT